VIMQRAGRSITEIFQAYGETTFREWESAFCREFSEPAGLVISTGGGALVSAENRIAMQAPGNILICLSISPDVLLDRLKNSKDRPLATDPQRLLELYKKRLPAYQQIRLKIDTTNLEPSTAAEAVIRLYQRELDRTRIRTRVQSPEGEYDILCGVNLLSQLPRLLIDYDLRGRTVVATNETLAPLYGQAVVESLPNAALVTIPDGELYKNLATVEQLYRDFAEAGLDRAGLVIALGGGVVGDTVGFAAATYMRGVRLIQVPTSLLSMVDSSVGGKVGVDIPEGKNLVGAFKQPEMVLIDTGVLKTLPEVELRCGLAEAIKHALLADPDLLNCIDEIRQGDPDVLRRVVQVKVDVVQRDPFEQGERAHLNLGHTFGHAIERVSGYQWRHGEAVAVGMAAAAKLSTAVSTLTQEKADQIIEILQKAGLPTTYSSYDPGAIWEAMHTDKKWRSGHSQFVILEDIGRPNIVRDVPRDIIVNILESIRN